MLQNGLAIRQALLDEAHPVIGIDSDATRVNQFVRQEFISASTELMSLNPDILGVVHGGSRTKGLARISSDIDCIILSENPDKHVQSFGSLLSNRLPSELTVEEVGWTASYTGIKLGSKSEFEEWINTSAVSALFGFIPNPSPNILYLRALAAQNFINDRQGWNFVRELHSCLVIGDKDYFFPYDDDDGKSIAERLGISERDARKIFNSEFFKFRRNSFGLTEKPEDYIRLTKVQIPLGSKIDKRITRLGRI